MRNLQLTLLLSLPLLCLGLRSANSAGGAPAAPVIEGELLVGVRPSSARFDQVSMIVNALGRVAGEQPTIHAFRVRLNRSVSMQYALDRIRRHADVTYVEPNHIVQAAAAPNDPSWGSQYGPKKMQVDQAWDYYEPQAQTVVAVLDTGVDYNHPDLSSVLYRDASGAVIGYNAINGTTSAADDHGHGTHCAGTIAARINNGVGVAGVAGWNPLMAGADNYVKIMPVKVLDSTGNGSDSSVANGIIWAADRGAKVISLSLGGAGSSTTTYNAVNYAWNKGCIVIAAAGNSGVSTQFFPAAYTNVISVGATDGSDTLASFSNYGSWVKVAAPGVGILSTYVGGGYASMNGTSMATPHVAGLAALLRSQSPGLTNSQLSSIITGNVDAYYPYSGRTLNASAGRVNAYRALLAARGTTVPNPTAPAAPTNLQAAAGNGQVALTWAASTGATSYSVKRSTTSGSGYAAVTSSLAGTSFTDTGLTNGTTYYYVVSAANSVGSSADSSQVVANPASTGSTLAAPTNLKATVGSYVYLTWSGVSGANTYTVKRSTTSGSGYTTIGSGISGTNHFDFGVNSGTTYYYVVTAVNATGESAPSAQVSTGPETSVPTAPAVPTNLQAAAGNGQVALTWTASSGATGYHVKRSTTNGSGYQAVTSGLVSGSSYTDTSVTNGTTYYYVVTAVNNAGESASSSQVAATPASTGSTLAAPTNLKATVGSYVYLTWSGVSGAASYRVKRSTTSGTGYTTIGSGITGTNHFDFGVNSGTTYYYVVTAVNAAGESAPSAPASTGGGTSTPTVPVAPTGVQAAPGSAQITLTWTASSGATGYHVKRSTTSGSGYVAVTSGLIAGTSYTDTNVTNGTTYYYVVTAANDAGESAGSSQVAATPASTGSTLPAPANLKATVGSYVYLTWNAVPGASTYTVKRSTTSGTGFTPIATGLTGPTHFDFGVNSGTTYYYVVTAVNAAGESAPSAQVSTAP